MNIDTKIDTESEKNKFFVLTQKFKFLNILPNSKHDFQSIQKFEFDEKFKNLNLKEKFEYGGKFKDENVKKEFLEFIKLDTRF